MTYLWGEPFIQPVFLDALRLWKKLGFTILVTTNATTLNFEKQAEKFLPYIDQLILSVQAIDPELQQTISRTKVLVEWDKVFENIEKHWKGNMLKANIVITQDNLPELFNIVKFLQGKWCKEIAITYPDVDVEYYSREHVLEKITPRYSECVEQVVPIVDFCEEHSIRLKLPDFPFCVFPEENREKYIPLTDDFDYANRLKAADVIMADNKVYLWEVDREEVSPREREHVSNCEWCKYKQMCWWPSNKYKGLYGLDEINSIR